MNDDDNHAAMTGPSYRGVGPSQRGTALGRVAQASSMRPDPRAIVERATALLDAASGQRLAEAMRDELMPFFKKRYGKFAGAGAARPGSTVSIRVLAQPEFSAQVAVHRQELLEEERALITTYAPAQASDVLSGVGRGPVEVMIPVTKTTRLTEAQIKLIRPQPVGEAREPGGFYSSKQRTIYLRADHAHASAVAHEMTHAYGSRLWNELHVALVLQRGSVRTPRGTVTVGEAFRYVDEGVTSALAQQVLDDWHASPARKGSVPRPPDPPRGLVGYMPDVGTTAEKFFYVIDKTYGSPKQNTFLAYFGGQLSFIIDEAKPAESEVQFGRDKRRLLAELF